MISLAESEQCPSFCFKEAKVFMLQLFLSKLNGLAIEGIQQTISYQILLVPCLRHQDSYSLHNFNEFSLEGNTSNQAQIDQVS